MVETGSLLQLVFGGYCLIVPGAAEVGGRRLLWPSEYAVWALSCRTHELVQDCMWGDRLSEGRKGRFNAELLSPS